MKAAPYVLLQQNLQQRLGDGEDVCVLNAGIPGCTIALAASALSAISNRLSRSWSSFLCLQRRPLRIRSLRARR